MKSEKERKCLMKKDIVFIKDNSFVYKDNEYGFYEFLDKNMKFKNLKAVVLGEELYIKNILIKSKYFELEKYIANEIKNIFSQNGEILYDYEKSKNKNSVYIYSIRGKEKVEKLCSRTVFLEVTPLQFIIRKTLKNIFKNKCKDYMSLIKFDNKYYFIKCSNDVFIDNYVSKDLEKVCQYIDSKYEKEIIIIDNKCFLDEYSLEKLEIIKKDIVGAINENL